MDVVTRPKVHNEFAGRKVRIPPPKPGYLNPSAGKIGTVSYAGWDDQYLVHVEGVYFCRTTAAEIEPCLIPKIDQAWVQKAYDDYGFNHGSVAQATKHAAASLLVAWKFALSTRDVTAKEMMADILAVMGELERFGEFLEERADET